MPGLLFLCHRLPHPPNRGEKIRAWRILDPLARPHRAPLGCLAGDPADHIAGAAVRGACGEIGGFAAHPRVRKRRDRPGAAEGPLQEDSRRGGVAAASALSNS